MKRIFLAITMIAFTGGVHAQSSTSTANAGSNASANVAVGSQSAAVLIQNNPGNTTSNNYSKLDNVPAVSAPSVFGGGHPCLAGKSGGIAIAGFGGSYGEGKPEPICQLWYMGQPEAAIRLLVMTVPGACIALGNVGYYRIGKSVVPFKCGAEVVKGGVDTPGFKSRTTKVSTRNAPEGRKVASAGYVRCELMVTNQINITYKFGADKAAAKTACLSSLGY